MNPTVENHLQDNSKIVYQEGPKPHTNKYETRVPRLHQIYLLFFSIVISLISLALPSLQNFANSFQSNQLAIGLLITKGQLPYTDLFATGGILYYALIGLSYLLGNTLSLILIQFIAFFISGIYFYKIINYFTLHQKFALVYTILLYLFQFTLGFGGMYPIQFSLPFLMISLWFLVKYFAGIVKDEAFILYGFAGSAAMLIEPRTLIYWGLSLIAIAIFNIKEKHFARGFYQILCIILGTILVFYTAGYFILNLQLLFPYIAQAIVYPFTYFANGKEDLLMTLIYQLALLMVTGQLTGILTFKTILREAKDNAIKWLLFILVIVYSVLVMITRDYHVYHLLTVLPFGLILTAIYLNERFNIAKRKSTHRRLRVRGEQNKITVQFFKSHFYLPIIIMIGALAFPIIQTIQHQSVNQERKIVSNYLQSKAKSSETLYAWDDSSIIHIKTGLKGDSQFLSPLVYTSKKSHLKLLEDELLQHTAKYIVVNKSLEMSSTLKKDIKKHYKTVKLSQLDHLEIYIKK
ncbi:hypothetical protein HMPREF9318_00937 [Streptococcus urinalis FB127-CNA-2]|uniref:Membrane protein n=1 Tax=Streptococcus urinalis 2285-97 TaxID=764291 RepID=G5KGS1_9STRE|nr:hypothetical protein [Streptococcus urinalis]EHJ57201.1 putative membrane protein [Streptococcus urinalis 2285-97]EKS20983.1 hypothetical protein HMPREF9318_00937 [Streptococcus urinalis FB127-CNA-2]VEF30992.1 membrane protein [Streptococcus urinalis]